MSSSLDPVRLLPLVALVLLGGCPPSGPQFATLDTGQANAVDLILVGGGDSFCVHGDTPQLKAVVTLADGRKLETWSFGSGRDGKLPFDQFEWGSSFGAIDSDGRLTVGRDPFALMEIEVVVKVRVADRPELTDEVRVTPTFDCGGVVDLRGSPGQHGRGGSHGRAGRPGQSGDSSRSATDGESGGHGQDGGDAGRGERAPDGSAAVGYVTSKRWGRLVLVRVGHAYLLVDPRAGKRVVVVAQGGSGGGGGSGGSGGQGGGGGSNNIEGGGDGGNGGDGGDGGRGGNGADGGEGGFVAVYYDARYEELRDMVAVLNGGGAGGNAGAGGYAGHAGMGGSSASGKRGTNGRQGVAGQPGVPGRAGPSGPAPEYRAATRDQLFSAEIAAGLPIE
ncbi:MAG TPA: hypothetical protein VML75_15390 [Kofleriaceae bacterium]|nr:hypothetical protein [Kofleriaceae bacterium]